MNQVHSSDELSGKKLVDVTAAGASIADDDLNDIRGTNDFKQHQTTNERSPLIRPRRPTDVSDEIFSQANNSSGATRRNGSVPLRQTSSVKFEPKGTLQALSLCLSKISSKPINSVMSLLLVVVIDLVLVFAANLKTDHSGVEVKPQHVLVYLMILISIFVVWMVYAVIPKKLKRSKNHDSTLIPSHLLTGVGIFGTASALTQMLLFVDFIKCSKYVHDLSCIYAIYPIFKITFVYFQMYFFYKLSRDGIDHSTLPHGQFFVMITLATNLCIWVSVFFNDVSSNPKLRQITWLKHYYYGVTKHDLCANESLTGQGSRDLHAVIDGIIPYITTFSMEYALLASGLLLHIWLVIKKNHIPKKLKSIKQPWTLWRIGFIIGLLAIPVIFVAYMREQAKLKLIAPKVTLHILKAVFFLALMFCCFHCVKLVSENRGFLKKNKPMKLEVILLGISGFLGFPAFDLACSFAAICEVKHLPALEVIWYGICCMCELFAMCVQFFFVKKAYQYKIPKVANKKVEMAAKYVRQYVSFALVVNIAYWAAKTYELRRTSDDPSIAEQFFGKYTWFALSHFSLPLCIFFYFHLAICYANIVSSFSQFGPLWQKNKREDN